MEAVREGSDEEDGKSTLTLCKVGKAAGGSNEVSIFRLNGGKLGRSEIGGIRKKE